MAGDTARSITFADLQRALVQAQEYDETRIEREVDAYQKFMDGVPDGLKAHAEIRQIASLIAMSQSSPVHPAEAARVQKWYEGIVRAYETGLTDGA